jgi:hypothetical protein
MKKTLFIIFLLLGLNFSKSAQAQCSVCTRNVQQLGEKPAKDLNAGIIYLAFAPLIIVGFVGYQWWRKNRSEE